MRLLPLTLAAATTVIAVAALAGCSDDEAPESRAATASDLAAVPTDGTAPAPSTPAATTTTTSASPTPSPSASPTASTPDGTTYALLTGATATALTYDKVDYRKAACDALAPKQPVEVSLAFRTCFSNVNALKRTVPVASTVGVTVLGESGAPVPQVAYDELLPFLSSASNTVPAQFSVFALTVRGGRVIAIEQSVLSYS